MWPRIIISKKHMQRSSFYNKYNNILSIINLTTYGSRVELDYSKDLFPKRKKKFIWAKR
jgi:hypothetical protein